MTNVPVTRQRFVRVMSSITVHIYLAYITCVTNYLNTVYDDHFRVPSNASEFREPAIITSTIRSACLYACLVVCLFSRISKKQTSKFHLLFSGRELTFTFAIICYRPSVCLSSVTLVHSTQPVEVFGNFFSPYDSSGTLVFWCQHSLVGDAPFPVKFAFKVTHPPFKQRNFDQYRLTVPQPW